MEGDYHVGPILDALKQQLGVDDNTLLVFTAKSLELYRRRSGCRRWKQWRLYSPTFIRPARGRNDSRGLSRPVLRWPVIRKGIISRWTRTRTSSLGPFAWVLEPALKVVEEYLASVKRETQYFEMFANRGIYHDGWYACTTPPVPPWLLGTAKLPEINDYKWELYNIADDYSQNNDLAARIPISCTSCRRCS